MKHELELISLNVDDLDIEELEQRLELAFGVPIVPDLCAKYGCGCWSYCAALCPTQCCTYDPCP
ncbi:MAG: hypothetical protein GFH27_549287n352 [Chloroflexi bacterium AL-W]|nr:hypothetical protein [Chloroflexi bacterium AL-N1]NOK66626.1 hypothetical protein [Chloroflexi bacterium AL-N10]NOK72014.1 hypothetical protein [Chloroflexi bacterium AL-N5]NOK81271.1 hypothetical protein [Chloroflexi bacterium AL-W]NOK89544.1 hypothetical protein [Chloroflexi bacterium AL-N15]